MATYEKRFGKFCLYIKKDTNKKIPKFIRISYGIQDIGVFLGYLNYGRGKGIEFFTNKIRFGIRNKFQFKTEFSGSRVNPYTTTIRFFGCFFIAYGTTKRMLQKKESEASFFCNNFGLVYPIEDYLMQIEFSMFEEYNQDGKFD